MFRKKKILIFSLITIVILGCYLGYSRGVVDSLRAMATVHKIENESRTVERSEMKRIKTLQGEIEIPVKPKRIVAMNYLGYLLTLGVKPVGAGSVEMKYTFLQDKITGIADVGESVERIVALDPDLIITMDGQNYEILSLIAPTVVIPWSAKDVYDQLREIAVILDREKEAEKWIKEFEIKEQSAREQVAGVIGKDETVAIYEIWGKGLWVINQDYGRGARNLYRTFKFTPPAAAEQYILGKNGGINLSLETLPQYAADHMFILVSPQEGGAKQTVEIMESQVWKNLSAVKNNHFYEIDRYDFWSNDPISLENQLDIQVKLLLSKNQRK